MLTIPKDEFENLSRLLCSDDKANVLLGLTLAKRTYKMKAHEIRRLIVDTVVQDVCERMIELQKQYLKMNVIEATRDVSLLNFKKKLYSYYRHTFTYIKTVSNINFARKLINFFRYINNRFCEIKDCIGVYTHTAIRLVQLSIILETQKI